MQWKRDGRQSFQNDHSCCQARGDRRFAYRTFNENVAHRRPPVDDHRASIRAHELRQYQSIARTRDIRWSARPAARGGLRSTHRNAALVARPFVIENFAKVAHIDPATAVRTWDEVLPLVLRLAAEPFADDGLGRFHRRFCRSNVVCALRASTSLDGPLAPVSRPR